MRKLITSFLALTLLFGLAAPVVLAAEEVEATCSDGIITSGAGIMDNVTCVCWDEGNCSLEDILQVFINVSDYILGVVGSLALLLFVIGGFYFMFSQGESARIAKGKKYMMGAVVGILIVFFAYIGVQSLQTVLKTGTLAGTEGYQVCDSDNDGAACAENSECYMGACYSTCAASNDLNSSCYASDDLSAEILECSTGEGVCPGEDTVCCVVFEDTEIDWDN